MFNIRFYANRFAFLSFLFFSLTAFAQSPGCADVKNGVFIFFSKADGTKSVYTRTGSVQKEFIGSTRETILWDLEWINDCSYLLQYNSGLEERPKKDLQTIKKHKIYSHIDEVTNDYYVFETHLDNASTPLLSKDTLWIKQRKDAKNKTFSNPGIDSIMAVKKAAYDSSLKQSAFLYIFRPHKHNELLDIVSIYYNDELVCKMSDNSAYALRLMKEGQVTIMGKMNGREVNFPLDVKYGEKYFVRCDAIWGLPGRPALTKSNLEEAKPFFGNQIK